MTTLEAKKIAALKEVKDFLLERSYGNAWAIGTLSVPAEQLALSGQIITMVANAYEGVAFTAGPSTWPSGDYVALQDENTLLRRRLEELEHRLKQVEERLTGEQVVVLREITREQAGEEIKKLFLTGETLYYSDIARKLRLDLELVVGICRELLEKGEIQVGDKTS